MVDLAPARNSPRFLPSACPTGLSAAPSRDHRCRFPAASAANKRTLCPAPPAIIAPDAPPKPLRRLRVKSQSALRDIGGDRGYYSISSVPMWLCDCMIVL